MKIVYHYTAFGTVGGTDRIILSKASYLADVFEYDVYLVTDSQRNNKDFFFPSSPNLKHIDLDVDFSQEYKHNFLGRIFWYFRLMRLYKRRLIALLDKLNPDIVVVTLGREMAIIRDLKCPGRKLVGETHVAKPFVRNLYLLRARGGIFALVANYLEKQMERSVSHLDKLVVLTETAREQWGPFADTVAIPNFNTLYPKVLLEEKNNKTAIAVGRLNEQKGFDMLIDSWKQVYQYHPDWKLNIFGSGEDKMILECRIKEAGLKDIVILNKPVRNIEEKYMQSDFYVLSSRCEGWGLVILEAMGCGIPCIAFDCPDGPRHIIQDGINGILVKNGDVLELANKICWMIEHPDERKKMGTNGRKRAQDFSKDKIMEKWHLLFECLSDKNHYKL